MRTLDFKVDSQILTKDDLCDFTGLMPGTNEYLNARFSFSKEWDGCVKIVEFSSGGNEYAPQVLDSKNMCTIDSQVSDRVIFNIRVLGKKGTFKIVTNKISVRQNGGVR